MNEILSRDYGLLLLGRTYANANFIYERPFCLHESVFFTHGFGGAFSYVNAGSVMRNCYIGRYCSLSTNLGFGMGQHPMNHITSSLSINNYFASMHSSGNLATPCKGLDDYDWWPAPTFIGNDVWIGANAFAPGAKKIRIGNGAVIAANSVITKDVPAYAVVAGNPAKIVKMRFKDEICADLEKIAWWDYDLKKLSLEKGELLKRVIKEPSEFIKAWENELGEIAKEFMIAKQCYLVKIQNNSMNINLVKGDAREFVFASPIKID